MDKQPLTPLAQAVQQVLADITSLTEVEQVSLDQAQGRVLSKALVSPIAVPPFANSQMDGYAGRFDELRAETFLPVRLRVPAGSSPPELPFGSLARIFTGAPIPEGADTVIMQEDMTTQEQDGQLFARPSRLPDCKGRFVRQSGADIQPGQILLGPGRRLGSADIGFLASVGVQKVDVFRQPRVAIFSTGDELVQPGGALGPGQIFDSNRPMMRTVFGQYGLSVSDLGRLPDKADATREALQRASHSHDMVLTCGGVSVGEEDHVKAAVTALGSLRLWKLAMKPGKPFAFGQINRCYFVGLPGNPVSAWVTFFLLGQLLLRRLEGETAPNLLKFTAPAGFDWPRPDPREEFLRGRLDDQGFLHIHARQDSHILSSLVESTGLIRIPGNTTVVQGDRLDFFPYRF
jgi:molybdopterin molybdotransferase